MVNSISNFKPFTPKFEGKRKLYDTNIYTFDIETTSYFKLNGQIYPAVEYINLTKSEQEQCEFFSNMYVWQFGINDTIYYGRTWEELIDFFEKLKQISPYKKYVFVHNLAFEFQFLRGVFEFNNVMARATHKVMRAELEKYNIEFRCTYFMTNVKLSYLPELYNLKTKKLVGDLDYTLLRHSNTPLTQQELNYIENDCLIIYEYIQKELEVYKTLKDLPLTNTGKVRKELHELIDYDYNYKNKTIKATNTDPHVFMLLCKAFAGGYTHANWTLADEILKDVDSWDFTSSYPYVMCAFKYPMTKFKPCKIRDIKQMSSSMAYLIRIRFYNIKCKYFNTFISMSKCIEISGASYDNGRVISAKELEIVVTDVDLKFIIKSHKFDYYDIKESYYSLYDYLPTQLINFILDKYVAKTKYKNVEGKEVAYNIEKGKFNSIYGMCVTNLIKNDVNYDNIKGWTETELTNSQIEKMLIDIEKRGFLSFAWRVLGHCLGS